MTSPQASARRLAGLRRRLGELRARVRAGPGGHVLWRVGVTLAGVLVIAVGIVLLPLPGPGWLIIFTGLGILATEYAWAMRLLQRGRRLLGEWSRWVAGQSLLIRAVLALASFAFLVAVLVGCWYLVRLV